MRPNGDVAAEDAHDEQRGKCERLLAQDLRHVVVAVAIAHDVGPKRGQAVEGTSTGGEPSERPLPKEGGYYGCS